MSGLLLFSLADDGTTFAGPLASRLDGEEGDLEFRRFPDGESYLRFRTPVDGREIALICSLDGPDAKLPPLLFAAAAARELGASRVGLVCPYLAYMRQDRRFHPGEAVTSVTFANLLSGHFDWLVTVDPHLHRWAALSELYRIPAAAIHAAPVIADWIAREVPRPLLIGPDSESEQWVSAVAEGAGARYRVLAKTRRGDRDVEVTVPDIAGLEDCTPVLVDDIASTAHTMIETVGHVLAAGLRAPVCIAVHGIFAENAYAELEAAGAARIVTTNSIGHASNAIDITGLLAEGVRSMTAAG